MFDSRPYQAIQVQNRYEFDEAIKYFELKGKKAPRDHFNFEEILLSHGYRSTGKIYVCSYEEERITWDCGEGKFLNYCEIIFLPNNRYGEMVLFGGIENDASD